MKILIAVTLCEREYLERRVFLSRSILNVFSVLGEIALVCVYYQSADIRRREEVISLVSSLNTGSLKINLKTYDWKSTSRARNAAISDAYSMACDYIIFHDSSVILEKHYLSWLAESIQSRCLLATCWAFADTSDRADANILYSPKLDRDSCIHKFNPNDHPFVCAYAFPLDTYMPYFNPDYGPGDGSKYPCGEDYLFLDEYFTLNPSQLSFRKYRRIGVVHPRRPPNNLKRLEYAFGQGRIHRLNIFKYRSLGGFIALFLFIANAFLGCLLLKPHAFLILKRRLQGLASQ